MRGTRKSPLEQPDFLQSLVDALKKELANEDLDADRRATLQSLLDNLESFRPANPEQDSTRESEDGNDDPDHQAVVPETTADTWTVNGTVKDKVGNPLSGVTIRVASGMGSLRRTGEAVTDETGQYSVTFGPGYMTTAENGQGVGVQAASVYAMLDGYVEANLCRQGDRLMADRMPTENTAWGPLAEIEGKLIVKGKPVTIHFVMKQAAKIDGFLVDQDGRPLQRRSLSITGPDLPPSSSVYEQVYTDLDGRFTFNNVPTDFEWQIELDERRIPASLLTPGFRLKDARPVWWQLTADFDERDPSLTSETMTEEMVREAEDGLSKFRQTCLVQGQAVSEEQLQDLKWGDVSRGLQAALDIRGQSTVAPGDLVDLQLLVRM